MSYSQHKSNKPLGVPPHFQQPPVLRQQQPLRNQPVAPQSRPEPEHTQVPHRSTVFHQQQRHPSPGPIASPGIQSGASPSPSSSPNTPQGLATGPAHDMSKQGAAPSHPGLAPSPHQQGNVVAQPPQTQQPQPPHGVIIPQPYLLQGQQQQLRPVYMPRSMSQPSPRGTVQIQPAPSPQQLTPGGQLGTQYMSQQPFVVMPVAMQQYRDQQVFQQTQGQYQTQPPQFQTRSLYTQQYQSQPSPGPIYQQPTTPSYYTNSPPVSLQGASFFPGTNQAGMVVTQTPMRQAYPVLPQAPQYNPTPGRKKIYISIVDPKSNQDITETIIRDGKMSTGLLHSGHSSASDTPPSSQTPPQNYPADEKSAAIQADFAAQVARLASEPALDTQPAPDQVAPPQQTLPPAGLPPKPVMPSPVPHIPDAQPQIGLAPVPSVEPVPVTPVEGVEPPSVNQAVHPSLPQETKVQEDMQAVPEVTPVETSSKETVKATFPAGASATPVQAPPLPTDSTVERTATPPPRVDPKLEPSDSQSVPESEEKNPPNPEVASKESDKNDQQKVIESSKPSTEETKPEESLLSKESKVDGVITTKQAAKEESAVLATQESTAKEPSKKKNQKNRFREIDKKPPKDEDEFEAYRSNEEQEKAENTLEKEEDVEPPVPRKQESPVPEVKIEEVVDKPEAEPEAPTDAVAEPEQKEVVVIDREDAVEQDIVETENAKNKEGVEDGEPKESLKDNKMQLKYTYREDQWSPMNPEGKKQYGRDFLLQFQPDCKEKPEGLPHIPDIVLEKADIRPPSFDPPGRINRGADFTPSYLRSPRTSQTQPSYGQGMAVGGGGRRSSKEPKKVIQRVSQTIKLNTAGENAWKPDKDMPSDEEEAKTKDLFKKMKALLNKLTPNNFETLKKQAIGYPIDTEERLKGIIDLVFEKAINESSFSKTYANLCRDLSQLKVPAASGTGMVQFRTLLINRCQKEFEKEKNEEQEEQAEREKIAALPEKQQAVALEDLTIKLIKNKKRMLGNIRFIGELFMLQMLIEQIMHDCIYKLLCSKDDESLECMVHLLMTIGKMLDHERAKNRIDQYFHKIKAIIGQKTISARIRFLLQDVLELRGRHWVPRRVDEKPKTIEQIREDHKREEEQKFMEGMQAKAQLNAQPPRMSRNKRDQPLRVGPPQAEGWNTVGSKAARVSVDPNKFKVTKPQNFDEEIQLGPARTTFGWGSRGSSGGSTKALPTQDSNRFTTLSEDKRGRGPTAAEIRGRGPPGFGKRSSSSRERDQASRERQSAILEAQKIGQRSHSEEKDRDSDNRRGRPEPVQPQVPVKEPPPKPAPAAAAAAAPKFPPGLFEKKSLATIQEYLNIRDIKEAITCVSELNCPSLMNIFVTSALNHSLEKTAQARDLVGVLLHSLLKAGYLTNEKFVEGMKEVLGQAEDMALDIPLIWKYLGEIIGSVYRDNSISLSILQEMMDPVREARKAGDLMAEILLVAVKINGANVVAEMWKSAGFRWEMFLPEDKDVQEFVNSKKLEFTLTRGMTSSAGDANGNNVATDEDWVLLIKRELGGILRRNDNVNNDVFDWIQKNLNISSSEDRLRLFIRALVTVVVQSTIQGEVEKCRLNHDLLVQRTAILKRYIDNDNSLELEALYAVQALNQNLENPPRLLGFIFNVLYDEDVIPEETFYAWKDSTDPNEALGKGVALKSVTSFFDWLREAEEEPAPSK